MFCRNCGASIEQETRFCGACGASTSSSALVAGGTEAPKNKARWAYFLVAVGFLLLMWMCNAASTQPTTPSTSASPESTQSPLPPNSTQSTVRHKVNENVLVGYWAYRCMSAHWQNSIGSGYTTEYPDASFLIVDLAIRNNDKTASTLPPVKLVDSDDREYDESSKGIIMQNSIGILKSLNPGVSSRGYVVFDVPAGKYALKVSGGFTSGASELIDLP